MNDAERTALGLYIRNLADRMRLCDWEFMLSEGETDDGVMACFTPTRGRRGAEITVCADWQKQEPDRRRQAIVHELIHAHVRPVEDAFEALMMPLGSIAYTLVQQTHEMALEYAVDAIADIIAPSMPLPHVKEA